MVRVRRNVKPFESFEATNRALTVSSWTWRNEVSVQAPDPVSAVAVRRLPRKDRASDGIAGRVKKQTWKVHDE